MQPGDLEKRISDLEEKIDEIYVSVEKTRKYFLWTMIITVVVVVLPLIGLMFVIPAFINNYTNTVNTLGI
jgi:type II secretory pathway component PulF